jgi:hypothetical protein
MSQRKSAQDAAVIRKAFPLTCSLIEEMIESYKPGPRKGVPRGDPLPVSTKRYAAATWMVFGRWTLRYTEVAKLAGTTHATVLTWRSDYRFRSLCIDLAHDLVDLILYKAINVSFERPETFKDLLAQFAQEWSAWIRPAKVRLLEEILKKFKMLQAQSPRDHRLGLHLCLLLEVLFNVDAGVSEEAAIPEVWTDVFYAPITKLRDSELKDKTVEEAQTTIMESLVASLILYYKMLEASRKPKVRKSLRELKEDMVQVLYETVDRCNLTTVKAVIGVIVDALTQPVSSSKMKSRFKQSWN